MLHKYRGIELNKQKKTPFLFLIKMFYIKDKKICNFSLLHYLGGGSQDRFHTIGELGNSGKKGERMRKRLAILLVLTGGVSLCSMAYGAITGSAHDFSNTGWSNGQICLPCHAPHNNIDVEDAPLWNHTVSDAVYELYSSPTFTADDITQPGGVSKLCLSCHDGTVAIDAFGGTGDTGGAGNHLIGEGRNIGTDLSNDHPVSFTYDSALVAEDGGLFEPATTPSNVVDSTGTIETDMLFAGRMECASCHDVHNKYDIRRLLKVDNSGSALCLTCHDK